MLPTSRSACRWACTVSAGSTDRSSSAHGRHASSFPRSSFCATPGSAAAKEAKAAARCSYLAAHGGNVQLLELTEDNVAVLEFGGDEMLPVALAILMPSYLLMMIGALMMNAVFPEIERRAFLGKWLTLLRPGPSVRAIRAAPSSYLLTIVGMFIGNMIGGLGVIACYFGIFISMPLGYAIASHAIAQWSMIVDDIERQQD